jgi:2-oxo-3-hexenedioate decarboxylase
MMDMALRTDLTTDEQALYDLLQQARADKLPVAGKNARRGVDLAGAYRIQEASQGERILKGYKLGLISPAKQQQMGLDTPIYGRIYADMLHQNHISMSDFIQPRMEPEIAVVLRDAILPDASEDAVSEAIGGYFLGVDILDSIWSDYQFSAPEVIADNASGGGFLLAGAMSNAGEGGMLRLYLNGKMLAEGTIVSTGNPIERLQWLSGQVGGLSAGMIIFFGSPAAAIPVQPGTLEIVGAGNHRLIGKIIL